MLNKLVLIITLLAYTNTLFAEDCVQSVTLLDKGVSTPCRGFLFSQTKELELFDEINSYKLLQQEDKLKDSMITDLEKQTSDLKVAVVDSEKKSSDWQQAAEKASKEYQELDSSRETKDLLLFGSGVLTTVVLGLVTGFIIKK